MQWLQGKKTYVIASLMVAVSLTQLLSGDIGLAEFAASEHLNTLLEGVGLATLRAGVSKDKRH